MVLQVCKCVCGGGGGSVGEQLYSIVCACIVLR